MIRMSFKADDLDSFFSRLLLGAESSRKRSVNVKTVFEKGIRASDMETFRLFEKTNNVRIQQLRQNVAIILQSYEFENPCSASC